MSMSPVAGAPEQSYRSDSSAEGLPDSGFDYDDAQHSMTQSAPGPVDAAAVKSAQAAEPFAVADPVDKQEQSDADESTDSDRSDSDGLDCELRDVSIQQDWLYDDTDDAPADPPVLNNAAIDADSLQCSGAIDDARSSILETRGRDLASAMDEAHDSGDTTGVPLLSDLHKHLGTESVEGGEGQIRYRSAAAGSNSYPFDNITHLMLFAWVHKYNVPQQQLQDLLDLLKYCMTTEPEGTAQHNRPDQHIRVPTNAQTFMRTYRDKLPLLELVKQRVTDKDGLGVDLLSFPINLVIQRLFLLPSRMHDLTRVSQSAVLTAAECNENSIVGHHISPLGTRPIGNKLKVHTHGQIFQRSPHWNVEAVRCGELTVSAETRYSRRDLQNCSIGDVCALQQQGPAPPVVVRIRAFYVDMDLLGCR